MIVEEEDVGALHEKIVIWLARHNWMTIPAMAVRLPFTASQRYAL